LQPSRLLRFGHLFPQTGLGNRTSKYGEGSGACHSSSQRHRLAELFQLFRRRHCSPQDAFLSVVASIKPAATSGIRSRISLQVITTSLNSFANVFYTKINRLAFLNEFFQLFAQSLIRAE